VSLDPGAPANFVVVVAVRLGVNRPFHLVAIADRDPGIRGFVRPPGRPFLSESKYRPKTRPLIVSV
jgi:hypothetical protein